ncbi:MAG: DUF6391 domain-containing protein [Phototrophicaceae bacterium]
MLNTLVTLPFVRQTRRNHGLEHATIHLLSRRIANLSMAGRSDHLGFFLIGEASTETITRAVSDALGRLKGGDHGLAIHPNCGTNLVTTAYLTAGTGWLTLTTTQRRNPADRFITLVVMMLAALLVSPYIGTWLQKHVTTDGDPADLEVMSITRQQIIWLGRPVTLHRVQTRSS